MPHAHSAYARNTSDLPVNNNCNIRAVLLFGGFRALTAVFVCASRVRPFDFVFNTVNNGIQILSLIKKKKPMPDIFCRFKVCSRFFLQYIFKVHSFMFSVHKTHILMDISLNYNT